MVPGNVMQLIYKSYRLHCLSVGCVTAHKMLHPAVSLFVILALRLFSSHKCCLEGKSIPG